MRPKTNPALRPRAALAALALATPALLWALAAPALAATSPAPHWTITSTAGPTIFTPGAREECGLVGENTCDSYTLIATNSGGAATDGSPITIADTLPAGVVVAPEVVGNTVTGVDWAQSQIGEPLECTVVPLQCVDERPVAPDGTLQMTIKVEVTAATGTVSNEASVSGGGADPASTTEQTEIGAAIAPFGAHGFGFETTALDGSAETGAAAHPYEQSTAIDLATHTFPGEPERPYRPTEEPRDVVVTLPPGFLGNPQATPRCPITLLEQTEYNFNFETPEFGQFVTKCPPGSRVGVASIVTSAFGYSGSLKTFSGTTSVFNLVPEGNHPAELGFRFLDKAILIYADLARSEGAYSVRAKIPGLPLVGFYGTKLTLFGQPGARDGEASNTAAFITNPARCDSESLNAEVQADSWEHPGSWVSRETAAYPPLEGCELLQFNPELALQPESTQADSPTGLNVSLKIPRSSTPWSVRQSPQLRDATVTLPQGLAVSPSAADGLVACPATGPNGIDIPQGTANPDEAGVGEALGPNGLSYLTAGNCPAASTLGTVEVDSPLVPEPLQGHVYLGTPDCSPCSNADAQAGKLLKLYIEAAGSGAVVKLPGTVSADPATGRLVATFKDNPQLPFSDLRLHFKSGPRAALATPPTCGHYTTTSDLKPWSAPATPDATPSDSFDVSSGPGGGACAGSEAAQPNQPSFEAGTASLLAGAYSPFVLKLSREDGSQRITGIDTTLPPGLTGRLAGVPYCSEAQLVAAGAAGGNAEKASPSCPLASEVGTVNVGAGAGSSPFYVQGHAYLAGPYKGAPLSLAIITPAVAGPFDLGTVVVRAALYVNQTTAQIHAVSDPIPTILAGIPLDVRSIALDMSRNQFTLNPTSCDPMAVLGAATTLPGQSASLSSPFQVGACAALGFKPKFSLRLKGATKRAKNPALIATLKAKPGEANVASTQVTLPRSAFLDQAHIRTVCTRVQFAADACPAGSIYGRASASTPLLDYALSGPVYLRSSNHKLPDLVVALKGPASQPIEIDLAGRTDSVKGALRNSFEAAPDAPVSKFRLELFGGRRGLVVNSRNLCAHAYRAKVALDAQSGKAHDTEPAVANSCNTKAKKHRRHGQRAAR